MSKIVITKFNNKIISSVFDGTELVCVNFSDTSNADILNNIYIARVENIVKNINAAFVAISPEIKCYFPLSENPNPIFLNNKNNDKVNEGDLILVQVTKEAVKTKMPTASSNISLQGKYCVLTKGNKHIGISNKIHDNSFEEAIKKAFKPLKNEEYGFVVRTNAYETEIDVVVNEAKQLVQKYDEITSLAKHRPKYTLMYSAPSNFISQIKNLNSKELTEILVEDEALYNELFTYLNDNYPNDLAKLRLYKDDLLPLAKLYAVEEKLNRAVMERVWLKSGAYLVIQPTEALTVIDVNTGKFDGKIKDRDATFLKINMEAADEIAKQMVLRNLSGIIIVDFIDMTSEENNQRLLNHLAGILKKDPIKTNLCGMTRLGLVEITRKKIMKPLYEEWRSTYDKNNNMWWWRDISKKDCGVGLIPLSDFLEGKDITIKQIYKY